MIIDLICYFEKSFYYSNKEWMKPEQIKIIEELNGINEGLVKDCLSMSTISLIISVFYNNENLDLYNLDDLIYFFENIEKVNKVVREKITNDFQKSYVYKTLDWLINEFALIYVKNIKILKNNHFELYWEKNIYPKVLYSIKAKELALHKANINSIFENIAILKNINKLADINIYVSYMSIPTAFTLYNGYLDNVLRTNLDSMLAHELMHGFASDENIELYKKYVSSNEFLANQYKILRDDYSSGDEEEMVMGAEYYLLFLAGLSKDRLLEYAKTRYSGCCPTAVEIFKELILEKTPPSYNNWLKCFFKKRLVNYISIKK